MGVVTQWIMIMNTNNIKVSVIVPCCNNKEYIRQSVESILNQSYNNIEIIVVDDGSTEDIKSELLSYIDCGRITYIKQENRGQGSARNTGIRLSAGELIVPFDSDDLMPSNYIKNMVPHAIDLNTLVVPCKVKVIKNDEIVDTVTECQISDEGMTLESILEKPTIPNSSMYSRHAFDLIGGYDERQIVRGVCEDWDLFVRMFALGVRFVNADCFYYWRMHDNNCLLGKTDQKMKTKTRKQYLM